MRDLRSMRSQGGFSLIELIIIMAIVGMLALFGYPAILAMAERAKLQNTAREAASMLRLARIEAVKRSMRAGVHPDYPGRQLVAFADTNNSGAFEPGTDRELGRAPLPTGVDLWGPPDGSAAGANATVGFDEDADPANPAVFFDSMGAAHTAGAFRLRGKAQNFLEVRVDPPTTGRVSVRKWFGGAVWYEQMEGGRNWKWYEEGETPVPPP
jgi:prepilin-type N-terminal cleavage/methylation domain-containing protein